MFIRKALTLTSLFVAISVVLDKLFGKVKFLSMILDRADLQALLDDPTFDSLQFTLDYDNKTLAKDNVTLQGYVARNNGKPMQKKNLQVHGRGKKFDNDRSYSSYELKREDIEDLLSIINGNQIVFEPEAYKGDASFVSYRLKSGERFSEQQSFAQRLPAFASASEGGTTALRAEPLMAAATLSATLNPSPPALKSYQSF